MTWKLDNQEIGVEPPQESINTTTAGGKLVFHIFGAMRNLKDNSSR